MQTWWNHGGYRIEAFDWIGRAASNDSQRSVIGLLLYAAGRNVLVYSSR
jgi:hypothetical protein